MGGSLNAHTKAHLILLLGVFMLEIIKILIIKFYEMIQN